MQKNWRQIDVLDNLEKEVIKMEMLAMFCFIWQSKNAIMFRQYQVMKKPDLNPAITVFAVSELHVHDIQVGNTAHCITYYMTVINIIWPSSHFNVTTISGESDVSSITQSRISPALPNVHTAQKCSKDSGPILKCGLSK